MHILWVCTTPAAVLSLHNTVIQAVRRMPWVHPKPAPASKLQSVNWEEEKQTGPPWKHMKALTREKKVEARLLLCKWNRPALLQK